jgi:hypothetical protein
MPSWTHLIRFIAKEDYQEHIGQLVDTTRDVGLDTFEGREVKAYNINGTVFDGKVTRAILTVQPISHFPTSKSQIPKFPKHQTNSPP